MNILLYKKKIAVNSNTILLQNKLSALLILLRRMFLIKTEKKAIKVTLLFTIQIPRPKTGKTVVVRHKLLRRIAKSKISKPNNNRLKKMVIHNLNNK